MAIECKGLRRRVGACCTAIVGGADKESQIDALKRQPHIVVATPGRLLELVEERVLRLGEAGRKQRETDTLRPMITSCLCFHSF